MTEDTSGGLAGKLAGKAKEAAGALTGNDTLAREGRLQQAGAEADLEARERAADADSKQQEADLEAERAAADEAREDTAAAAEARAGEQDAARLEQEARLAEARANAIDPERGWPCG